MKTIFVLCVLIVDAYCAPILDAKRDQQWSLFKHTHEKQYNSTEEETARYIIYNNSICT